MAFVSSIFKYFFKSPKIRKICVCLNRIESMSLLWNQSSVKIENWKVDWSYFDRCLTTIKSFHLGLAMNLKGFAKVKLHDIKDISYMITYSSHFMWNFNLMQNQIIWKPSFLYKFKKNWTLYWCARRKLGELFAHGWLAIENFMLVCETFEPYVFLPMTTHPWFSFINWRIKGDMYLACTWTNDFQVIFTNAFSKNMVLPSRWCD